MYFLARCFDPSGAAIPVQGTEGGAYRRRTAQYCVAHDRLSQAGLDDASQAQGPSETLVTGTINWTEHRLRLVQGGQAAFIEVPSQSGEPGFILILPISFQVRRHGHG